LQIPTSRRPKVDVSTILLAVTHLTCLLAFFVRFSWGLVALALAGYVVHMWVITAGYHRYFAHRTYRTSRVFQFVLAFLGASAMQNGAIWWASIHRRHHKDTDGPGDPHSPLLGFWYAHMGWFLCGGGENIDLSNVADLTRYPELRFIERWSWVPILMHVGLCYAIAGVPGIVWGFAISTCATMHATFLINSLAHVSGTRRYATADDSRNNWLLALITFGEGWHNNHHRYESSARQGFRWWELDITYVTLRALAWARVVRQVREPPRELMMVRLVAVPVG
jgi:stearoyl-CoA desaturase (delta-9 desaturase)